MVFFSFHWSHTLLNKIAFRLRRFIFHSLLCILFFLLGVYSLTSTCFPSQKIYFSVAFFLKGLLLFRNFQNNDRTKVEDVKLQTFKTWWSIFCERLVRGNFAEVKHLLCEWSCCCRTLLEVFCGSVTNLCTTSQAINYNQLESIGINYTQESAINPHTEQGKCGVSLWILIFRRKTSI